MKKRVWIFLLMFGLIVAPTQESKAVWWWVVKAAVKKAIKAADLAIQRQQNKVIWLQNAQKVLENTMSKLKLTEISDWTERQKELYKNYFEELNKVKVLISYYQRVREITARQLQLVEEYKRGWRIVRGDKNFTPNEIEQIADVYEGILNETIMNVEQLELVINSFKTQMSDAKRLEIIRKASEAVDQNFYDLRQFNTENAMMSMSRTKDQKEIAVIRRLYGIE